MEVSEVKSTKKKTLKNESKICCCNASLAKHIKKIKKAKKTTEKICAPYRMDAAQASIEILWEIIFDYLCCAKEVSTDEMNSLSSVVQRLSASRVQLANFTMKAREISGNTSTQENISTSTVEKIENILKLL